MPTPSPDPQDFPHIFAGVAEPTPSPHLMADLRAHLDSDAGRPLRDMTFVITDGKGRPVDTSTLVTPINTLNDMVDGPHYPPFSISHAATWRAPQHTTHVHPTWWPIRLLRDVWHSAIVRDARTEARARWRRFLQLQCNPPATTTLYIDLQQDFVDGNTQPLLVPPRD